MARKFNPQHWQSRNGHVFTRYSHTRRKVKQTRAGHTYHTTELATQTEHKLQADFVIKVDAQALIELMLNRAAWTKNGKAAMLGGIVTAQRSNERVLEEKVTEYPVQEGTEVISG
jgi:hypothetical protein